MKSQLKKGWRSFVPRHMEGKSATRFCVFPKVKSADSRPGSTPVYLNVYDLTPINGYFYWAGVGIFHSGVEVHGVEYGFGAHDYPASGVFEVEPRQCPGFQFRKSIFIGTTYLNKKQVREFMELQAMNYHGDTYHLIVKNCNHFCADMCHKLAGKRVPKWVNRLARIGYIPPTPGIVSSCFIFGILLTECYLCFTFSVKGSFCNCILPEALKTTTVRHDASYQDSDCERKSLRSSLSCFSSISLHQDREMSLPSLFTHFQYKGRLPHLELKRSRSKTLKDG